MTEKATLDVAACERKYLCNIGQAQTGRQSLYYPVWAVN